MRGDVVAEVDHHLVDVAPAPALRLMVGLHHGMACGPEVLRRMRADRLVTASDMAADPTDSEVHPRLPRLQALLAAVCGGPHFGEPVQVGAVHKAVSLSDWASGHLGLRLHEPD